MPVPFTDSCASLDGCPSLIESRPQLAFLGGQRKSPRNSDAGSTPLTKSLSRARVQAT